MLVGHQYEHVGGTHARKYRTPARPCILRDLAAVVPRARSAPAGVECRDDGVECRGRASVDRVGDRPVPPRRLGVELLVRTIAMNFDRYLREAQQKAKYSRVI